MAGERLWSPMLGHWGSLLWTTDLHFRKDNALFLHLIAGSQSPQQKVRGYYWEGIGPVFFPRHKSLSFWTVGTWFCYILTKISLEITNQSWKSPQKTICPVSCPQGVLLSLASPTSPNWEHRCSLWQSFQYFLFFSFPSSPFFLIEI